MRRACTVLAIIIGFGGLLAGCAYRPVPGAERDLAYSVEASAGGR